MVKERLEWHVTHEPTDSSASREAGPKHEQLSGGMPEHATGPKGLHMLVTASGAGEVRRMSSRMRASGEVS